MGGPPSPLRSKGSSSSLAKTGCNGDVSKELTDEPRIPGSPGIGLPAQDDHIKKLGDGRGLFHIIEQLAALESALWSILDGLKTNATHVSYFCREYWGTASSHAQLSLEKLGFNERLKRQVQQACVLESLSLGVASHLCSGTMQGVSVTIRSRLRNLLYYVHENCLVLLDLVCQRWLAENPYMGETESRYGHCPENLNLDILVRVKRYRRLRRGEHIMALRQHNEMIANVVRQLCRGATTKRVPLSSRSPNGDRSPGTARGFGAACSASQGTVLSAVNEVLASRMSLDRLKASNIRSKMLQYLRFEALLAGDFNGVDSHWPTSDPYRRYGTESFSKESSPIWFECLPPMLPILDSQPKLPPMKMPDALSLVLDLDETLVHYSEHDGMGSYEIRPGMYEFLQRMHGLGYELVIFTAATQDYADWVIDQIDPERLIHHRLYRQHALPWGPIFVKDLSRIGRDLDRTLIIDNVQENFMLQPHNGIFILSWYDDPQDTALFSLTPLLEEWASTKTKVHEILHKYSHDIPAWAGHDLGDQLPMDMLEYDQGIEDAGAHDPPQDFEGRETVAAPSKHGRLEDRTACGSYSQTPSHQPQQEISYPSVPTPHRSEGAPCHTPLMQTPQHPQPPPLTQQHTASLQQPQVEAQTRQHGASSYSPPSYQSPDLAQGQPAHAYSYHPQTLPSTYSTTRSQPTGYPQAQAPTEQQDAQRSRCPVTQQHVAPQIVQRRPAPSFSGVAGPFQAAPQYAQAPLWGRAGAGPCQAPRR